MFNITGANWMMNAEGAPTKTAMILSLLVVMGASTLSAMSGVGRGIKWLSNINMGLSLFILLFFILFGSTMFVFKSFFLGLYDYLLAFPRMSLEVWSSDGSEVSQKLADWHCRRPNHGCRHFIPII